MPKRPWTRLVEGDTAESVWRVVERVAKATREPRAVIAQAKAVFEADAVGLFASLSHGCAGAGLLHAYLHYATGDERHAETAVAHVETAAAMIDAHQTSSGLFGGFVGVSWVTRHLAGRLLEDSIGLTDAIDAALLELLRQSPWPGSFDVISGLVGFGVYGMEGLPEAPASKIVSSAVARLAEIAEHSAAGTTWRTLPQHMSPERRGQAPGGLYNLGLAHGQPGVLRFLASASAVTPRTRPLLADGVRWLMAQRLNQHQGSVFPGEIVPGRPPTGTRLAWCYGDLGIGLALLASARALQHEALEEAACGFARDAARRDPTMSGVVDAGLCHGSAGLALMFARLWHMTADREYASAARFWLERTLAFERPRSEQAPFLYQEVWPSNGRLRPVGAVGFLNGAAGTALALLALVTDLEPEWDRVLLLS